MEKLQQSDIEIVEWDPSVDTTSVKFDSYSYTLESPEGKMYLFIDEDRASHRPVRISAYVGKTGSILRAWIDSFCRLATLCLESRTLDINDLRALLSNQSSDKESRQLNGVAIRSGPEALYIGLSRYIEDKQEQRDKQLIRGRAD